jgi:hypothetical protein
MVYQSCLVVLAITLSSCASAVPIDGNDATMNQKYVKRIATDPVMATSCEVKGKCTAKCDDPKRAFCDETANPPICECR